MPPRNHLPNLLGLLPAGSAPASDEGISASLDEDGYNSPSSASTDNGTESENGSEMEKTKPVMKMKRTNPPPWATSLIKTTSTTLNAARRTVSSPFREHPKQNQQQHGDLLLVADAHVSGSVSPEPARIVSDIPRDRGSGQRLWDQQQQKKTDPAQPSLSSSSKILQLQRSWEERESDELFGHPGHAPLMEQGVSYAEEMKSRKPRQSGSRIPAPHTSTEATTAPQKRMAEAISIDMHATSDRERKRSPSDDLHAEMRDGKRRQIEQPLAGILSSSDSFLGIRHPSLSNAAEILQKGKLLTEQDLMDAVKAINSGMTKRSETSTPKTLHNGMSSTSKPSLPASRARPTVVPITRALRPVPSSSEDANLGLDTEEDQDRTESDDQSIISKSQDKIVNLKESPNMPRRASIKSSSSSHGTPDPGRPITSTITKDRLYTLWRGPDHVLQSACGALLPSAYKLYHDSRLPWVCPVRDCRRLFTTVVAIGAHFGQKHQRTMFNDNLDGTLSRIGPYGSRTIKSPPIVVSTNPLDPNEPPMPDPCPPVHSKSFAMFNLKAEASSAPVPAPHQSTSRSPVPTETRERRSLRGVSPSRSSSTSSILNSSDLSTYIRTFLSPAFAIPDRPDIRELLQLPRVRTLPRAWKLRYTGSQPSHNTFAALLLCLTGDVSRKNCLACRTTVAPFDKCIVLPAAAPDNLKELLNGTCGSCWFRSAIQRQKNMCSFLPSSRASPACDMSRESQFISPPTPPRPVAASLADSTIKGAPEQMSTPASVSFIAGNVMPASVYEMEDWEVAPGRIREDSGPAAENVAFSNSYLTVSQSVPISSDVSFNVLVIRPGGSNKWSAEEGKIRICSLAAGKVKVKVGGLEFHIGPNGMFKIKPGVACMVENRLYIDAIFHVSTLIEY